MKKYLFLLSIVFFSIETLFAEGVENEMNVMTFNIRLDAKVDGANQWTYRKDLAADLVRFYDVDIFGAQEVLHHQLADILERLPDFSYVGVGRTDGKTKGEYTPILYKKERFTLLKSGNFWLAEDMHIPGKKGWDAACERVATWAVFKDRKSGKEFFFLNTHLDHMGKVARHEGALLVLRQTAALAGDLPVILTGDFNAVQTDDPILVLTNPDDTSHLTDSRSIAGLRYGPSWSFHDFGRLSFEERPLIDYVFIRGNFNVLKHAVLAESLNHLFPSDHCPILTRMELK